jgi:glucokinase
MVLAGNISATTAHLGIFSSTEDGSPVLETEAQYASQKSPNLVAILKDFLEKNPSQRPLYAACFGISGPVEDGEGEILFLRWKLRETELSKLLTPLTWGLDCARGMPVELVNNTCLANPKNLEANGQLVDLYRPDVVHKSIPNRAWISIAGGLGEALFYWDSFNKEFQASSSEGGHANFAPRNPLEIELLSDLLKRFSPVNYSSVLSQKGLVNIYQFLIENTGRGKECAKEVTADVIIAEALAHPTDETNLCTQTLNLFVSILGAEAGNLALKYFALGGVYIGGVIAPKIVTKLQDGTFMAAFKDRENKDIAELLAKIPVKVVTNPLVMLIGAALRALEKELMGKALYAQCTR